MKRKPQIKLEKIALDEFLELLLKLQKKGALYIDIIGTPDEEQDIMGIAVRDEYIDAENNGFTEEEFIEGEDEEIPPSAQPLSDDFLNELS